MGSSQRRAPAVFLVLLIVVVGVLTEQSSTTAASLGSLRNKASRSLRRFMKRKLKQHPRGLKRPLMERLTGDLPPTIPEHAATDTGAISKYPDEHGRDLRRRPKRKWYGSGKGIKKSSKSKSSKGNRKFYGNGKYYRPSRSSSSKGKGKKSSKKGSKGSKGTQQNEKDGDGGIDSKSLGNICRGLDFGGGSSINGKRFTGYWNWGKGKGKRRELEHTERSLQFGGELCNPNAFTIASTNPDLSIFAELVQAANLEAIFLCAGPFTLLAPSNAAFNANPTLLRTLFNPRNIEALQQLLLYHILPGFYTSDDFVAGPLKTLLGEDVDITLNPLSFNQATATTVDVLTCNGVINIIDDLLIPPGSPVLPEICKLLDFRSDDQLPALTRIGTVFFHRNLEVEDETGLTAIGDRHRKLQFEGERCRLNVFDVAQENPLLETFVGLINAADLEDIFLCAGPFTVLAPTNESFKNLDTELLDTLLQPENQELLQEILLYHILRGFFPSDKLQEGPIETMLFENSVEVGFDPFRFDDAGVVRPDMESCNGIIHIIDVVLLPEEPDRCDAFTFEDTENTGGNSAMTILEVARQDPDFSTVVDLIELADLEEVFECPGPFTALFPANSAFDALDPEYLEFLRDPANRDELEELLLYHILPGATPSDDFSAGPTDTLLFDETVDVGVSPLTFDDAGVIKPDIPADNGIIDKIDTVLMPFPLPTLPPTAAPVVASDICVDFTFGRRLRMLQDGGENCNANVLNTARLNEDLTIVTALIEASGLAPIFSCAGAFTALLPTNEAFTALDQALLDELYLPENIEDLQNLLLYHILPGATLTTEFTAGPTDTLFSENQVEVGLDPTRFDDANVLTSDIVACNGYIDVIDTVLYPFSNPICEDYTFRRRVRRLQDGGENCSDNVLDTARQNPDLSTVTTLITTAGLAPIFNCAGAFTALLPTNEAFDAFDQDVLDELLLPENLLNLQNFLLYHILPGATLATEFTAGPTETLFTSNQVEVGLDPLQFDSSMVVTADVQACNGYIDVIDTVLDPFAGTDTSAPSAAPIVGTDAAVVATDKPTAAPIVGTDAPVAATDAPTNAPKVDMDAPVTATGSPTIAPIVATTAPSLAPSASPLANGATRAPVQAPRQTVRIQDYRIAYVTNADREPTEEEYIEMNARTAAYFEGKFEDFYAGSDDVTFLGVESVIENTGFQQDDPAERFDILIDFDFADVSYTLDSTLPATEEIFGIMRDSITAEYITDVVRTFTGTPFENCIEVEFDASERIVEP